MKIIGKRRPVSWTLLVIGGLFVALGAYAFLTGDAYVLPGRHSSSKHVLRDVDPESFAFWLRFYAGFGVAALFLAVTRVTPVEEGWRAFRMRSQSLVQEKGYDSKKAPAWAYLFLVGFVGLIAWIMWKTMYSE